MQRRHFGILSGSSLLATAVLRPAQAQSLPRPLPLDPSLLKTTLTPLGAERAGNADGSIPAWTGGNVTGPLPPGQVDDVPMFVDEQPLYTVDASNMGQYASVLSAGTQALMTRAGLRIKVYPTHRTAAAPQYVYDNAALNVTRAKLDPAGGRFGFIGGYGGPPFPIIDTSDPLAAGAQLIWNHLVRWAGYQYMNKFSGGFVVNGNSLLLVFAFSSNYICPYYDPNGSPETFEGYYDKFRFNVVAPPPLNGQEIISWSSTNPLKLPNINWELLNGQARVRKLPSSSYDVPSPINNGITNDDDGGGFLGSPSNYDWKLICKQEMLVPYNCNAIHYHTAQEIAQPGFPNPDIIRWEKHRVWVVEATLHPGERNTSVRRRVYIDEDTWGILLNEAYDAQNNMAKTGALYNHTVGSTPGTYVTSEVDWDMLSPGTYAISIDALYPPYHNGQVNGPQSPSLFDAEELAASSSF